MAPELFDDNGQFSIGSDLWALGCVLYELGTGRPPFVSTSFQELTNMIFYTEPRMKDSWSSELKQLLAGLLQKDPSKRITWNQVLNHPFFGNRPFPNLPKPVSPVPVAALPLANGNTNKTTNQNASTRSGAPGGSEAVSSLYNGKRNDILLQSYDQELNFAAQREGETQEETEEREAEGIEETSMDTEKEGEGEGGMETEEEEEDGRAQDNALNSEAQELIVRVENQPNFVATIRASSNLAATLNKHTERDTTLDLTSGSDTTQDGDSAVQKVALQDLFLHPSDIIVKPIHGNKLIEKLPELTFDPRSLSFRPLTIAQLLELPQIELESFLTLVYKAIGGTHSIPDRLNSLAYFETLCMDAATANMLVNSSLMTLLVRMIKAFKSPALKIRLCSVVSQLLRHATYIGPELQDTGLVTILLDNIKDRNEKIRRRAVAAFGELIFYIATQQTHTLETEDTEQEPIPTWAMPSVTLTVLLRCLKAGEDETVRHYAAKTVENIASQSVEHSTKFAVPEIISVLQHIIATTKNEVFRSTAATALSHLCRNNPSVFVTLCEKSGLKQVMSGLMADSPLRIQQAYINMLNSVLLQASVSSGSSTAFSSPSPSPSASPSSTPRIASTNICTVILDDKNISSTLLSLLEHGSPVIRDKCLLAFVSLFRISLRFMTTCIDHKLLSTVDRVLRETDRYSQNCAYVLVDSIIELIPNVLKLIGDDLLKQTGRKAPNERGGSANSRQLRGPLGLLPVLLHLLTNSSFKSKIVSAQLVKHVSVFLEQAEKSSFSAQPESKRVLLLIVESISQNATALLSQYDSFVQFLLPTLLSLLHSDSGDTRFLCLKMFTDILIQFLNDPNVYEPTATPRNTTKTINDLITKQLLPFYSNLLNDKDPLPLYALKLLSAIVERNPGFTSYISSLRLIPLILEFFEGGHSHNNIHTVRLVKRLVEVKDIGMLELQSFGIVPKVIGVFLHATQQSVDWCVDPTLDILYDLLFHAAELCRVKRPDSISDDDLIQIIDNNEPLLECFDGCVKLLAHADSLVAEKASHCLLLMLQLYGSRELSNSTHALHHSLLVPDHVQWVVQALQSDRRSLQRRVLKMLQWAFTSRESDLADRLSSEQLDLLHDTFENLSTIDDRSVALLARELARLSFWQE
eukprot:GILK01011076.1.p1 GENE.GILK01011076.1~~GILK01011076.1.p1  ORF type:complete len:1302 (+),score=266.67 GILK01011076.1:471-3908(+)